MELVDVRCPSCNALVQVNSNLERCMCRYCGQEIILINDVVKEKEPASIETVKDNTDGKTINNVREQEREIVWEGYSQVVFFIVVILSAIIGWHKFELKVEIILSVVWLLNYGIVSSFTRTKSNMTAVKALLYGFFVGYLIGNYLLKILSVIWSIISFLG